MIKCVVTILYTKCSPSKERRFENWHRTSISDKNTVHIFKMQTGLAQKRLPPWAPLWEAKKKRIRRKFKKMLRNLKIMQINCM